MDLRVLESVVSRHTLVSFVELTRLKTKSTNTTIRDFHLFMLQKHDENPDLWPLSFTDAQGGQLLWERLYNLWCAGQFVS